jgi:hypothetical protein
MTPTEAAEIRDRACKDKKRYTIPDADLAVARRNADHGLGVFAKYRCPFCRGYHVGHVMSVGAMEQMATAIRVLGGDGPGEPSGTVSKRERRRQRRKPR